MPEVDFVRAFQLLKKSKDNGIAISFTNEELYVRFQKGKAPDPDLLDELRDNKRHLIGYFKNFKIIPGATAEMKALPDSFEYKGERYFVISPVQLYWVDDQIDIEYKKNDNIHGTVIRSFRIEGVLDTEILKRTISYLVRRHESLRTTFHKLDGGYFMKVQRADAYPPFPEIIDRPEEYAGDESALRRLAAFQGHAFDMETGPLFLVRLIRMADRKYVLSFKIHHIIFDSVSFTALQRDFFVAYEDLKEGREPGLPVLTFQLKEYLSLVNAHARKEGDNDRKYWGELYRDLPPELMIPGVRRISNKVKDKIFRTERNFCFSKELAGKFNVLAGRFSTSLFVILQATFKDYFFRLTGQNDIMIGTYIFGREHPGCEDQIGCYAKTVLIRTLLDDRDTVYDLIGKVIRSNEEMRVHQAFSLKEYLEELLPPDHSKGRIFWNVNMQFSDAGKSPPRDPPAGNNSRRPDVTIEYMHIPGLGNSLIQHDMQLQFYYSNGELKMDIQYDGCLYDSAILRKFMDGYFIHVGEMLKRSGI